MIKYKGFEKLRIVNLIALCSAIDEFEQFDKDMLDLLSTKKKNKYDMKLAKVANGKICPFAKQEKEIYQRNKSLISLLQGYGEFDSFLWDNYYSDEINVYKELKLFMEYVNKHRDSIGIIIGNLEKLKVLGFEKIHFDEELDFTKNTYLVSTKLEENLCVEYLANLEAIPNYNSGIVKYKTNNSNYKITLSLITSEITPDNHFNSIELNSLLFSSDSLPKTLYKVDTFDKILELPKTIEEECKIIKDAVDLSTSIEELSKIHKYISKKIEELETVESKEELISLLSHIRYIIKGMQCISKDHNGSIVKKYQNVTYQMLSDEHKEYIKKRLKLF